MSRRPGLARDLTAVLLLILGLLLPWNIYVGIGIPGTVGWIFGVLVIVTVMSFAAVLFSYVPTAGDRGQGGFTRLRLALNIPYLLTVALFVGFALLQSVRSGGSGSTPPGVGPGIWAGVAGALLAIQRVRPSTEDESHTRFMWLRVIGLSSILLASAGALVNLYWRTRFLVPHIFDPGTSRQNLVVTVTALLYALVCLAPVILVARWLISGKQRVELAIVMLGISMLSAGVLVWLLPAGRDLDAFHGIAQNTSTAGVGFEGYLAWAAAAALIAPSARLPKGNFAFREIWHDVMRRALLLVAVWCSGCAVLRVADIASAAVLQLPAPPYNSTVMMTFDLVTAMLAVWLAINGSSHVLPRLINALLLGIVFVLTVTRVVIGVALVPRVRPLDTSGITAVYGNELAHQITSTFDIGLCFLSLGLIVLALVMILQPIQATEGDRPTTPPADAPATPVIARPGRDRNVPVSAKERANEVLAESSKRFAAGTTYGDIGSRRPR